MRPSASLAYATAALVEDASFVADGQALAGVLFAEQDGGAEFIHGLAVRERRENLLFAARAILP